MSKSAAAQYRKAILDIDEYLRQHYNNGTRVQVHFRDIAEDLNMNRNSASGAMVAISRIKGSGLSKCTKPPGTYEWLMPEHYPTELKQLKHAADEHTKTKRVQLQQPVMNFWRDHPDAPFTVHDVHDTAGGSISGVSQLCTRLAKTGFLEPKPDIGRGVYIHHSETAEANERAEIPTPADVGRTLAKKLAPELAQEPNLLYRFKQETSKGKIILEHLGTGTLGYWKAL